MPIKYMPLGNLRIKTIDGEEIGEIGEIVTITGEELQAESAKYTFSDASTTFSGTFKMLTNNDRKMRGIPKTRHRLTVNRYMRKVSKGKIIRRGR